MQCSDKRAMQCSNKDAMQGSVIASGSNSLNTTDLKSSEYFFNHFCSNIKSSRDKYYVE